MLWCPSERGWAGTDTDGARVARGWARAGPSVTGRCSGTTSRASPSQPSGDWRGGEGSRGYRDLCTRRSVPRHHSSFWKCILLLDVGEAESRSRAEACSFLSSRVLYNIITKSYHGHDAEWSFPHYCTLVSDPRGAARVPGERDAGRGDLHRARQAEDRHGHRRGVRSQAPGQDAVRVRVLMSRWISSSCWFCTNYFTQ